MTVDANSPTYVVNAAAKLAACSTWNTTLGLTAANIFYPSAAAGTSLPFAVIQPGERRNFAPFEGARSIPSGQLDYAIKFDHDTTSIAQIEAYAESLADELAKAQSGLLISGVSFIVGQEPEDGDDDDIASIMITIDYGPGA